MSVATNLARINEPAGNSTKLQSGTDFAFWAMIAMYAFARVLQVYPGRTPILTVVAFHVLPPAAFALIHGARSYGWRGILVFIGIILVVGNAFENIGVRTGFPFGRYYFTDLMGPKLSVVPILLGLAYVGMAYLSWTLAHVILGGCGTRLSGSRVVVLPVIASFLMVAWDLCLDPIWATVLRAWVFPDGGPYFGVPISNFLGWYLTVYVIFQAFALYLRGRSTDRHRLPSRHWFQAILFYGSFAAGNLLLVIPRTGPSVVYDPAGVRWRVSDITGTCALVTIFTMGVFTLVAWARLQYPDAGSIGTSDADG
jgi:uncharacterized membrane protein